MEKKIKVKLVYLQVIMKKYIMILQLKKKKK